MCTLTDLFPGWVGDDPAVDVADAHRAHGAVPGDVGGGEGGGGGVDGHHVGVSHAGGVHGELQEGLHSQMRKSGRNLVKMV